MPRCYTPPLTPTASPRNRASSLDANPCSRSKARKKSIGHHTVTPRVPLANHPVPSLDIPWTKSQPTDYLEPAIVNDTVHAQLFEIQQMLLSNFGKLHLHNAGLLARLQFSEEYMRAAPAQMVKGKKSAPPSPVDLPAIGESDSQRGMLSKGWSHITNSIPTSRVSNVSRAEVAQLKTSSTNDQNETQLPQSHTASGSFSRLGSNLRDMESLAKIISRHSNMQRRSTHARKMWEFFENRSSSKWAYFYGSYFAPLFLTLSVVISFVQTVDDWKLSEDMVGAIQSGFELWFAMEISIRFIVCPTKSTFWFNGFNVIDLISVLPLFIRVYVWVVLQECTCDNDLIHRVIGLVPMLRLLKILRRFHKFQLLLSAFSIAVEALPVLIFSLCLLAIMFSGLIFLCESRTLIPSLPSALWFVIVTMTTVGYGDVVPDSTAGKCFSVILMISSALYMALPIGIVGSAFSEVWKDRDRLLLISVLRESFAISGVSRQLVTEMFHEFLDHGDAIAFKDSETEMNVEQFKRMLRALQIEVTEDRMTALFEALDVDHGGTISCDEFIKRLFPYAYLSGERRPSFISPPSRIFSPYDGSSPRSIHEETAGV